MQFLGFWRRGTASRTAAGWRSAVVLVAVTLLMGAFSAVAEANPKFAALTVDARNGKILFSENADAIRHPASLTKMMTLYVLFQDLKSGRLKLDSPIRFSKRAASMAPSKLGVKAGGTITVETAIRALVVKSANDVAAAVAETLGGTEAEFARRMTRTARAIGMSRSTFANASGLPNPAQVTTARDMATLGLRLMRDFPQYYPYFRTQSFVFNGRTIRGHNRLLGKYEGTDGIKTGYINASGFNLVSSVRRGDKRLVGVVLGGKTGASRDAYMKQMLTKQFGKARGGKTIAAAVGTSKGATTIAEAPQAQEEQQETAAVEAAPQQPKIEAKPEAAAPELAEAPVKPAKPQKKTLPGRKKEVMPEISVAAAEEAATEQGDAEDAAETADASGADQPAAGSTIVQVEAQNPPEAQPQPVPQQKAVADAAPEKLPFQVKSPAEQLADQTEVASLPQGGDWSIQLGDFATKNDAQARLQAVRKKSPTVLEGKTALTMTVQKGGKIIYRARFSGFDEAAAQAACKAIKKNKSACTVQAPL